jgi:hypothetical protein
MAVGRISCGVQDPRQSAWSWLLAGPLWFTDPWQSAGIMAVGRISSNLQDPWQPAVYVAVCRIHGGLQDP